MSAPGLLLALLSWIQALAHVTKPQHINGNLLDMRELDFGQEPLLTFRRVDAPMEQNWLRDERSLDCPNRRLKKLKALDNAARANLDWLLRIGRETGKKEISDADFPDAFDRPGSAPSGLAPASPAS